MFRVIKEKSPNMSERSSKHTGECVCVSVWSLAQDNKSIVSH